MKTDVSEQLSERLSFRHVFLVNQATDMNCAVYSCSHCCSLVDFLSRAQAKALSLDLFSFNFGMRQIRKAIVQNMYMAMLIDFPCRTIFHQAEHTVDHEGGKARARMAADCMDAKLIFRDDRLHKLVIFHEDKS